MSRTNIDIDDELVDKAMRMYRLESKRAAIDLALDPSNPRILYAALWKNQRFPWGFAAGGGKSGLWKSTDGGGTWTDITGNHGLPPRPLGRFGITVSPANASRLWASVESPDSTGGIFRLASHASGGAGEPPGMGAGAVGVVTCSPPSS